MIKEAEVGLFIKNNTCGIRKHAEIRRLRKFPSRGQVVSVHASFMVT